MPHHWKGDPGTFFGSFFGQHKHNLPGQGSCSPLLPSVLTPGFKSPRDVPSKANKLLSSKKEKHRPGLEGKQKAQQREWALATFKIFRILKFPANLRLGY